MGCVKVHSGLKILKMVVLPVITMKVQNMFILFEGYMLQNVAECCIPRRGLCELHLNCQGRIKVIISGMGQTFFVLRHCRHILYVYVLGHDRVLHIKMR